MSRDRTPDPGSEDSSPCLFAGELGRVEPDQGWVVDQPKPVHQQNLFGSEPATEEGRAAGLLRPRLHMMMMMMMVPLPRSGGWTRS